MTSRPGSVKFRMVSRYTKPPSVELFIASLLANSLEAVMNYTEMEAKVWKATWGQ